MKEKKAKNEFLEWIKAIGFGLLLVVGVRYFLFTPVVVDGASMMPTLEDGDKLIVNKIEPQLSDYDRFDIVVFKANEKENYVKRIIGLPGDHIAYEDDVLYINGEAYEEPYLSDLKADLQGLGKLTGNFTLEDLLQASVVPEGHYFVLGDNRQASRDSRDVHKVGFVDEEKIIGTADFVFYPFDHISSLGK